MSLEHQDWETIYTKANKQLNSGGKNKEENKKKKTQDFTKENKMDKKIEEGNLKHDKTPAELSKIIQQRRLNMGLTQKDLANKINVQVKVIIDIESGKAKKNPQLISKIKRILNISN